MDQGQSIRRELSQAVPNARVRLAQVIRSLHEAQQQPDARAIEVAPSAIVGVKSESAGRSARRGFWEPL